MREIKYRAYDKLAKDWVYSGPMPDAGFWKWVSYDSETVLNEWTGLKDTNGVEIYEGDICKVSKWPDEGSEIRVVTYSAPSFYLSKTLDDMVDVDIFSTPGAYEEVIGNIYENPELLESK